MAAMIKRSMEKGQKPASGLFHRNQGPPFLVIPDEGSVPHSSPPAGVMEALPRSIQLPHARRAGVDPGVRVEKRMRTEQMLLKRRNGMHPTTATIPD